MSDRGKTGPVGAEQPVLDGMPQRLYSATPTRLTTWMTCPRRYRFSYLDRPMPSKGPPWAHNTVGAVTHNVLAQWWRMPQRSRTVTAAVNLVDRYWTTEGFRDDEQAELWRARVKEMVGRYVESLDPAVEPRGVERTVALVHTGVSLSGRADRIDERDGELVIVDYKTGRYVPDEDDARASLALAVYAAAGSRTLRSPCHTVELHHIPTGRVAAAEHSDQSLQQHLDRADGIAAECAKADQMFREGASGDEVFEPRPSPMCGWCDFRHHCPEGQQAGGVRQSWSGLAGDH